MSKPNPLLAGLRGRCPDCAEGLLFKGFLTVSPSCESCGFDLAKADSGDGPAVFVILIAGCVVAFSALFVEIAYRPPIWLHMVLWLPLTLLLCLGLLRPLKGLMLGAQFAHKASETRNEP